MYGTGELDGHLVSLLHPTSLAAEQYRAVRLHVENLQRERGLTVVGVSSPGRGDGKTLTAINLAGALAQGTDRRVVLLEADLRYPRAARYLGLPNGHGLSTYILDPAVPLDSVLQRSQGVSTVVAGLPSAMPYELLQSPRLAELVTALRERFDYVIVDSPPVLSFPDVGLLRNLVDGFLLVVRAQRTPRETVQAALSALGPDLALGIIFNADTSQSSGNGDDNS
jgi:capsular exopolysaccharide synthesis family protein